MIEEDLLSSLFNNDKKKEKNALINQDFDVEQSKAYLRNKKLVKTLKEKIFRGFSKIKAIADKNN